MQERALHHMAGHLGIIVSLVQSYDATAFPNPHLVVSEIRGTILGSLQKGCPTTWSVLTLKNPKWVLIVRVSYYLGVDQGSPILEKPHLSIRHSARHLVPRQTTHFWSHRLCQLSWGSRSRCVEALATRLTKPGPLFGATVSQAVLNHVITLAAAWLPNARRSFS